MARPLHLLRNAASLVTLLTLATQCVLPDYQLDGGSGTGGQGTDETSPGAGGGDVGSGGEEGSGTGGASGGAPTGDGGADGGTGGGGSGGGSGGGVGGGSGGDGAGGGSGGDEGTGGAPPVVGGNGYHISGDWAGFAFTVSDAVLVPVMPADFDDLDEDGPYCVTGTVEGTEDYSSLVGLGFNLNQPREENATAATLSPTGDGVDIDLTVNSGVTQFRVQLHEGDWDDLQAARWCTDLVVSGDHFHGTLPWEAFSEECWFPGGVAYDSRPIKSIILYVTDPGSGNGPVTVDMCVNDIGPSAP